VTIGNILRITKAGAPLALLLTLALVLLPLGAEAQQTAPPDSGVSVCNTASPHSQGGDLAVDSADPQAPVRFDAGLRPMGNGNVNAAMHSPALSLCSVPGGGGSANY